MDKDHREFEERWRRLERRNVLQGYFFRRGIPAQDIQDVFNNTGYEAWRSVQKLNDWNKFDAWVLGIANNMVARYWRDHATRMKKQEIAKGESHTLAGKQVENSITEGVVIDECLHKLNRDSQLIVRYRALEGYKLREISEIMGKSTSSVERNYKEALRVLRICLEGAFEGRVIEV